MQHQEILAKLTQARQAQAHALQRFARAQERLAQLEARQQALSAQAHASTMPDPDQAPLPPSTPFPEPIATPLPDQTSEADAANQHPAFLPENGELELLSGFTPEPSIDGEPTQRLAPVQSPEPPINGTSSRPFVPAPPHTPGAQAHTAGPHEIGAAEAVPDKELTHQAEEQP